jgi:glycosyltransferase involved in cell wall biosynthesis
MPSYGFSEFEEKKKYGIVGGLGVVLDEVLTRIAKEVNVYGIGMRHLRGRDLPNIEEIDGYNVFRPYGSLSRDEAVNKCKTLFGLAGFDFNGVGIAKADVVFTVGKNMVEEVKKVGVMHGISSKEIEKKIYPIHHGVDTKTYRPLTNITKEFDIIFIGRFAPVKGLMELIDAVSILKSKYPDIKVRLIGGGELEKDLEERVKREGLEKNIFTSTRWVPPKEKAAEINRARIAIAPSKYEPHGQFDLEAGACGVPCINGTGGFMERMLDNVTALQCNPFSPKDIAEKIDSLLSHEERIIEIGKNARDFINKYYGWAERASIYPEIFRSIIEDDLKALNDLPLVVPLENEFSSHSFSERRIKAKSIF